MARPCVLLCVLVAAAAALASRAPSVAGQATPADRMAGVPLSKRDLYMDAVVGGANAVFVCFDGSASIPGNAVNDDYCDCNDGSDEPGTSACANSQFYCANKGHVGQYLPASRVNDGICDCCDGSDEASNPVLANRCKDTCLEAGAAHRAAQAEAIRVAEEGARMKAALAAEGREGVGSIQASLAEKRAQLADAEAKVAEAEAGVVAQEALEKAERLRRDGDRDGIVLSALGLGEGQPGGTVENLREVLLALVRRMNASSDLVEMLNERARATYSKQLAAFNEKVQGGQHDGVTPPVPVVEVEWPESVEAGGYVRPEAEAARNALSEAEEAEASLQSEVATLEKRAGQDYGPNNEWWNLRDRCIETTASKSVLRVVLACVCRRLTGMALQVQILHLSVPGCQAGSHPPRVCGCVRGGVAWLALLRPLTWSFVSQHMEGVLRQYIHEDGVL